MSFHPPNHRGSPFVASLSLLVPIQQPSSPSLGEGLGWASFFYFFMTAAKPPLRATFTLKVSLAFTLEVFLR